MIDWLKRAAYSAMMTASAQGAVIFTDIEDIGFFSFGTHIERSLDLNSDGVEDVVFHNFGDELAVFSTPTSSIEGIAAVSPNLNSFAAPISVGSIIGSSATSVYTWNQGYSGLISVKTVGMDNYVLGLWGSLEAYLGVEFRIGNETHYGWVQVDTPFLAGGGIIKSFAYESEAGKPIVAGVIPEPSVIFLAGFGMVSAVSIRRRK